MLLEISRLKCRGIKHKLHRLSIVILLFLDYLTCSHAIAGY